MEHLDPCSSWQTFQNGSMENENDMDVQPPLPIDPPPNLMPLPMMKQELADTDSQMEVQFENNPEELLQDMARAKPMCRDFIRGTCDRTTCIYAHVCDPNQLYGVYTFCHKYQNTFCTYRNCKFVHATVFEEQHFYRTGFLPPKTLAHIENEVRRIPTPPPEETCENKSVGVYKFCQQFRISHCTIVNCTSVHATDWEEQNFNKTGFLPPHTLAHIKDKVEPVTPLPPPKESPVEYRPQATDCSVYSPSLMNNVDTDVVGGVSPNATQAHSMQDMLPPEVPQYGPAASQSEVSSKITKLCNLYETLSCKMEDPSDLEPNKCKHCAVLELKIKCREEILTLISIYDNMAVQEN